VRIPLALITPPAIVVPIGEQAAGIDGTDRAADAVAVQVRVAGGEAERVALEEVPLACIIPPGAVVVQPG
jgi:hypothetical protein